MPATPATLQIEALGEIPHIGLLPPLASPDGRCVTFLDSSADKSIPAETNVSTEDPAALFTGGDAGISLWLRSATAGAESRPLGTRAAAWPAFSRDGHTLAWIEPDNRGVARIRVIDPNRRLVSREAPTAERHIAPGPRRLVTPAFSPSGRRLAVAGYAASADSAQLIAIELSTHDVTPLPPPAGVEWQVRPAWIDEDTLLYLGGGPEGVALYGVSLRRPAPFRALKLPLPERAEEAVLSQAAIFNPFLLERHIFAWYDPQHDRIELYNLLEDHREALPDGSRAGGWIDADRFLFATDDRLWLKTTLAEPTPLLDGAWLPIAGRGETFLLLTPGVSEHLLNLVRASSAAL